VSQAFNVNQYWLERGRNYIREGLPDDFHRLQERFLLHLLRASGMPLDRILEIGCGFGRVTRLLAESFPNSQITALDLSPDQLENARRYCGQNPNLSFQQYDFYSGAPLPSGECDAIIAVEVFLHHPRPVICGLADKLSGVARHIVNLDWSEDWPWKTPEHVWVHDYRALYADAGLQCAVFALPQKIDGMQQRLFIAAKQLSPTVLILEEEARAAEAAAQCSSPNAKAAIAAELAPESARWPEQLEAAVQQIREIIPGGATFILVNDDQWGNESRALNGYRIFPFLEREGQYWGPPADDHTAVSELQRLRRAGATHLVFAWPSFWWLDHYAGLRRHLSATCELIHHNERLIIFRL